MFFRKKVTLLTLLLVFFFSFIGRNIAEAHWAPEEVITLDKFLTEENAEEYFYYKWRAKDYEFASWVVFASGVILSASVLAIEPFETDTLNIKLSSAFMGGGAVGAGILKLISLDADRNAYRVLTLTHSF